VLDVVDPFPDAAAERAFLRALAALVHESTTVVLGAPGFPDDHGMPGRPTVRLRLAVDDGPAASARPLDADHDVAEHGDAEHLDIDTHVTTGKETRR